MQAYLFVLVTASALMLSVPALSQVAPPNEPPLVAQETVPGSTRCQELRRACRNEPGPGEQGMGNCNWYRDNCR
jgi:hypothetical protein